LLCTIAIVELGCILRDGLLVSITMVDYNKKGKKLGHQHKSPTSTPLDCNDYVPRRGKHIDTYAHPQRLPRSSPGHL
jgi:hypothetical protein